MNIKTIAESFSATRRARLDLETQVKELKAKEDELKTSLLNCLSSMGAKTVSIEGVGRITAKDAVRYEIADHEAFMLLMLRRMVEEAKAGHPLGDANLFQRRASVSAIDNMIEHLKVLPDTQDQFLGQNGLRRVVEQTVSFTKF